AVAGRADGVAEDAQRGARSARLAEQEVDAKARAAPARAHRQPVSVRQHLADALDEWRGPERVDDLQPRAGGPDPRATSLRHQPVREPEVGEERFGADDRFS